MDQLSRADASYLRRVPSIRLRRMPFEPSRAPSLASGSLPASGALYAVDVNGQLHPGQGLEWLLTNGLGGFAASTVVGCNMRRYHVLLCAATTPPVGRGMALNPIGGVVFLDG